MNTGTDHSSDEMLDFSDQKNEWGLEPFHYREEKMTIHCAPHTHDDVGWLKTVDEYYSGTL
jgi:hypothetical protein